MSETFNHGYAVVIGVDKNNIKKLELPAVEKDVTAVYEVLTHPKRCAYAEDNVHFIHGPDATKNAILEAFIWLKDKVKADPEATAVIYYSGHGMRDKKTELYFLIPYDIQSLPRVRIDAIQAEVIQASISEIQAKRTLVILDCCHAQGLDVKDIDLDEPELDPVPFPELPETKEVPTYEEGAKDVTELAEGEGRAILNSSTGIESSYIRTDQKMSVFTYHLIEALTGHAPHEDEDTVVYVTDVMSWVTRQVKKTAAQMNKSQTPVMRTTGVFPVAQLIGGEGVALSKGVLAPDPLEPLPEKAVSVNINQEGQTVSGRQVNAGIIDGNVNMGDTVNTGGGDYAGGDMKKSEGGVHFEGGDVDVSGPVIGGGVGELVQGNKTVHNEEIHGDKVEGDKIGRDKISVGTISGGTVAIGDRAQAVGQMGQGGAVGDLTGLFAPLYTAVAAEAPAQMGQAIALKGELERGAAVDEDQVAGYILDLAEAAPSAKPVLRGIFADPRVSAVLQGKKSIAFALGRLK